MEHMNYTAEKNNTILVGTTSFASISSTPFDILNKSNYDIVGASTINRKFNINELKDILPYCIGVIAGTEPYNEEILSMGQNLKVISRIGVGLDNVDLEYAKKNNILVTTTSTDLSMSVSELTVAMILSLYKKLNDNYLNVINKSFEKVPGKLLQGKTIGIVGLGKIGKTTLKLLNSFNCKFLAYDKMFDDDFIENYDIRKSTLEHLFQHSDIICLHTSYNPDMYHLINSKLFSECNKKPIIINTSRGQIIDEGDLIAALEKKQISGAALDVFEKEPYRGPLCDRNDVLLTPHIASYSKEIREAMEVEAVNNLIDNL